MASMISDYKNAFRSFNRNVRLMLIYYAVNSVANGIVSVLMNLYFLKIGLDENFLGSTVFVQSIGLGLLVLPFGMLADRTPKHVLVKAGYVMINLPFTGLLFSSNPVVLLMLYAVQSLGLAIIVGSEFPYLTENTPPECRTHLFSITSAIYMAGPALGMAAAGYLPRLLGPLVSSGAETAAAYRAALMVSVAMFWAGGLAVLRVKESPEVEAPKAKGFAIRFSQPGTVLGLCMNSAFVGLAASLFIPFANVIMNQRYQMPAHAIGWVFTTQDVAIALGVLVIPKLAEKRGNLAGATLIQSLALAAYAILAFAPNMSVFLFGYVLRGTLANMPYPLIDTYTMEKVDPSQRGTVNAATNLARNVLWAVGGKIGGSFLHRKMYSLPLMLAFGIYGLAVATFAVMLRIPHMRDDAELTDAPETALI
ncbi:MAG: MFS transporter [Bacillota bacterium]